MVPLAALFAVIQAVAGGLLRDGSMLPTIVLLPLMIVIGSTALLIPLAGRVYAGAILRTGARVKVRDAWRAAA